MQRPKMENRQRGKQESSGMGNKPMNFKDAWKDTEESVINNYEKPAIKKEP